MSTVSSFLNLPIPSMALYSVFYTTPQPCSCRSPGEYVYSSLSSPFLRGGDPTPRVCRLIHFTAQSLHSGWTVCRTRHTTPLLFSPRPQAAFKWPLAEEARPIYRAKGRKQVALGLDLFQGYDYNGNLEEGKGIDRGDEFPSRCSSSVCMSIISGCRKSARLTCFVPA